MVSINDIFMQNGIPVQSTKDNPNLINPYSALGQTSNRFTALPAKEGGYTYAKPVVKVNGKSFGISDAQKQESQMLGNGQAPTPSTPTNATPNSLGQNLLNFATSGRGGAFGEGVLAKSGNSLMPVSFGEVLSSGMQSMNTYDTNQAKLQVDKEKFDYIQDQDAKANLLALMKITKDAKSGTANIKDYEYYAKLNAQEKKVWDQIDKNDPYWANLMSAGKKSGEQGTNEVITPAQLSYDTKAGELLADWQLNTLSGEITNLGKIDSVIETMMNQNVTGPVIGSMPFALKLFLEPEAINADDEITSIIYQSLRATLGAQFTENEGKRLVKTTFNKYLSEEMNMTRLRRIRSETEAGLDMKSAMADHLREFGTLKDWEGPDFLNNSKENYYKNRDALTQRLFRVNDYDGLSPDKKLEIYNSDISYDEKLFMYNNLEALGITPAEESQ